MLFKALVPPTTLGEAVYFKRRLDFIDVEGKLVPIQIPDAVDIISSSISPDKDRGLRQNEALRPAVLLAKLFMAFPNLDAWDSLGEMAIALYRQLMKPFDDDVVSFWAFNDQVGGQLPLMTNLRQLPVQTRDMFGYHRGPSRWEAELQQVIPQSIAHWTGAELVFWYRDAAGQQIPKELDQMGVPRSVHGLFTADVHLPAIGPADLTEEQAEHCLPSEILPCVGNTIIREYGRHGGRMSLSEYEELISSTWLDVKNCGRITYLVLRHAGGDTFHVQEAGFSSPTACIPVEVEPPTLSGDVRLIFDGCELRTTSQAILRGLVVDVEGLAKAERLHALTGFELPGGSQPMRVAFVRPSAHGDLDGSGFLSEVCPGIPMFPAADGVYLSKGGRLGIVSCTWQRLHATIGNVRRRMMIPIVVDSTRWQEVPKDEHSRVVEKSDTELQSFTLTDGLTDIHNEATAELKAALSKRVKVGSLRYDPSRRKQVYIYEDEYPPEGLLPTAITQQIIDQKGSWWASDDINRGRISGFVDALKALSSSPAAEPCSLDTHVLRNELDPCQYRALVPVASRSSLTVVEADYGTGKTRVIKKTSALFAKAGFHVLVCTPGGVLARSTADELQTEGLSAELVVGDPAHLEGYARHSGPPIWVSTIDSARRTPKTISLVLVDEAAQVSAAQVLSLVHVKTGLRRLALFGDPRQLPPHHAYTGVFRTSLFRGPANFFGNGNGN
eukprot:6490764-Amphidinium_carterae.1